MIRFLAGLLLGYITGMYVEFRQTSEGHGRPELERFLDWWVADI